MKHSSLLLILANLIFMISCAEVREDTDTAVASCRRVYGSEQNRSICISGVEIAREQIFKPECRNDAARCYRQALTFCGATTEADLKRIEISACTDGVDFMAKAISESSVMRNLYLASQHLPFNAGRALRTGEGDGNEYITINGERYRVFHVTIDDSFGSSSGSSGSRR
jgi:hypothetical protein